MPGLLDRFLAAGGTDRARVGVFVDGPNTFRDEFDVDLDDVHAIGRERGDLAYARIYLNEHATPGLVQAAEAHGFEVVVTSGDVDVRLAIDATEAIVDDRIDALVVLSRDTDFKPVLETAGRYGVHTTAVAPGEHGRSDALSNAADDARLLED